ncbi:type I DNA topoisomerase [Rhodovulum sp. DZ06]|uniref:type I DNA topoisomerase n=1 Tax=Rhodovulum sp. DZ06 TaxID=3425126 RepID=UPI003D353AF2
MAVVVVESPAKAKTINAYLGKDYTVLASYGHVRDLKGKDGSVDPDHDWEMQWEVDPKASKRVSDIANALRADDADELILATDPDREGEAISWHLMEALKKRRAIRKTTTVRRVAFNAITKTAVKQAIANPREIDMELVEAYLARRALDYLVGFRLSPVLWRKLPGAKSAGRVQSVCLRLIVEREMEIEAFRATEYWSVRAMLANAADARYEARLTHLKGEKLDRYDLGNHDKAAAAAAAVARSDLRVTSVEARPGTRNPSPPFMTSTLQQEASRKFGMGAKAAMAAAQRLYEAGHITYMRTDGIDMAPEAVEAARGAIKDRYGDAYVPDKPRIYKNKAKNAQEAHECIRPTDMARSADDLGSLEPEQRKLYDLIWKRTLASQMEAARLERTTVIIEDRGGACTLRATGQVVKFDGFMKVYTEGRDDDAAGGDDEDGARLPAISEGEAPKLVSGAYAAEAQRLQAAAVEADAKAGPAAVAEGQGGVLAQQHHTQPPPRYTEATLVKRMEELGIGRPSTYASIVTTIQDRGYVVKDRNRLVPEDKGRLVTIFLSNYFSRYVSYDFTAKLEEELDDVSGGRIDWKKVLDHFWRDFKAALDDTAELRISDVIDKIDEALGPHLFPDPGDGTDPRVCPVCGQGRLGLKTARSGGAFIGCNRYPECRYTRPLNADEQDAEAAALDGKILGRNDGGDPVILRMGRFGPYVQLGEEDPESKQKPKRSSLPKGVSAEELTLEKALELLSLPREVGEHPDGGMLSTNFGRFGPYVMWAKPKGPEDKTKPKPVYASIQADDVMTLGLNRAVDLIAQKLAGRGGRGAAAAPIAELGDHPEAGEPVTVHSGRYGPYVKCGKINATLPKGTEPDQLTMDEAVKLIAAKMEKDGKTISGKKAPAKKAAAKKKPAAKKPAAKKPAAKKAAAGAADDGDAGDVLDD